MSIVIAFPHTYASAEVGRQALACCYDVQLYMPQLRHGSGRASNESQTNLSPATIRSDI